jgi:hypothetical protein
VTISAVPITGRRRALRWRTVAGLALSLAAHALLFVSFRESLELPGVENEKERAPLIVEIGPPSQASPQAQPTQPAVPPSPPVAPSARRAPKPPARSNEVPIARAPQPARPSAPDAQNSPPADLSAMIAARRAQRAATEASDPPSEPAPATERNTQGNEIALENIQRSLRQGHEADRGLFRILHKGPRSASLAFRGWSTDSTKRWNQVFDVDAGPNGDLDRAIVHKMAELIHEHKVTDLEWHSRRLGRVVRLSGRREDGAELEEFLILELAYLGSG